MAIQPGLYNFTLQRAADWSLDLELKDGNGDPVSLIGSTVSSQVWDEDRVKKYADMFITYVNRGLGKVKLSLTDEQTLLFPESLKYDVLLVNPSGLKEYYLEGTITVSEGYTLSLIHISEPTRPY